MKKLAAILLVPAIIAVSLLLVLEGSLSILLNHPDTIPSLAPTLRHFYESRECYRIQSDLHCSVFNKDLGYVLRPGRCEFDNREFESSVSVNEEGIRGDNESLEKPDIIVIGDSFAMGWGVQQYAAFPAQLEISSGAKVLNAGLPDYGTPRQLKMLKRLDHSSLNWLIVEYSSNALKENLAFAQSPESTAVPTEDDYRRGVMNNRTSSAYYIGKYTFELLPALLNEQDVATEPVSTEVEAEALAAALSPVVNLIPARTNIVLIDVTPPDKRKKNLLKHFRQVLASERFSALEKRIIEVDIGDQLVESMYFPLDQHLTPLGHRLIADELCKIVGCEP